jgi:hypothetical protein
MRAVQSCTCERDDEEREQSLSPGGLENSIGTASDHQPPILRSAKRLQGRRIRGRFCSVELINVNKVRLEVSTLSCPRRRVIFSLRSCAVNGLTTRSSAPAAIACGYFLALRAAMNRKLELGPGQSWTTLSCSPPGRRHDVSTVALNCRPVSGQNRKPPISRAHHGAHKVAKNPDE